MENPLGVSPSKENQGTTRGKEKIILTSVGIEPTTSGLDLALLCRLSYEVEQRKIYPSLQSGLNIANPKLGKHGILCQGRENHATRGKGGNNMQPCPCKGRESMQSPSAWVKHATRALCVKSCNVTCTKVPDSTYNPSGASFCFLF